MIEFRNGRFHAKGVSFAVPEGFFINTTAHFLYEYGLEFCHPELKYSITIHLDETKLNAYREIELGFEDYNIKSCEKKYPAYYCKWARQISVSKKGCLWERV